MHEGNELLVAPRIRKHGRGMSCIGVPQCVNPDGRFF